MNEPFKKETESHMTAGKVFDFRTDLDQSADAYAAMDERRALESLVQVSRF